MKRIAALLLVSALVVSLFTGCSLFSSSPKELEEGFYAVLDEDGETAAYITSTGKKLSVTDADGAELLEETKFKYDDSEKVFLIDGDEAFSLSVSKKVTTMTVPRKSPLGISRGEYTLELTDEDELPAEPAAASVELDDAGIEEEVTAVRLQLAEQLGVLASSFLGSAETLTASGNTDSAEELLETIVAIEAVRSMLEQEPDTAEQVNVTNEQVITALYGGDDDPEEAVLIDAMSQVKLLTPDTWLYSYLSGITGSSASSFSSSYSLLSASRLCLTDSTPECAWFLRFSPADTAALYENLKARLPEELLLFTEEELAEGLDSLTLPSAAVVFVYPATAKADPGDSCTVCFEIHLLSEDSVDSLQELMESIAAENAG